MPPRLSRKADTIVLQVKITKSHKRKAATLAQQADFEGNVSRLVRALIDDAWSDYEAKKQSAKKQSAKAR